MDDMELEIEKAELVESIDQDFGEDAGKEGHVCLRRLALELGISVGRVLGKAALLVLRSSASRLERHFGSGVRSKRSERPVKAAPPLSVIDVRADITIRNRENQHYLDSVCRIVTVFDSASVRAAVLDLVQEYWPLTTGNDILWSLSPEEWDGVGPLQWSTAGEIDGTVEHRQQ